MRRMIFLVAAVILLDGCAMAPAEPFPRHHETYEQDIEAALANPPLELALADRLSYPEPVDGLQPDTQEQLYSLVIDGMEIGDALRKFASAYGLNLIVEPEVEGDIEVNFNDLPLQQAMALMLDAKGYYWRMENGIVRVGAVETRRFSVDYLRLVRTGEGSTIAKVSSSTESSGGGGDDGGSSDGEDAGSVIIGHTDEVHFWSELDAQIRSLLSSTGTVIMNRLSGTVVVRDQHRRVEDVADYLAHIERAIHRQVDIRVNIIEVELGDATALGVNWARIGDVLQNSPSFSFAIDGQVLNPAGGFEASQNVLRFQFEDVDEDDQLAALVTALDEQGEVQIVSQPHVRTMNNQTSLIKVGTDRTFFRREQSVDSTSAGSITTSTDVPQVVTEGVVLSITPQIADNGWIMMDISPVVTRVSSITTVEDGNGVIRSSAPNLDVAQVTSLVRARSGETVVIGGLIQSADSQTERQIPGTRWMGALKNIAGGTYRLKAKKELVMVLTPVVVGGAT